MNTIKTQTYDVLITYCLLAIVAKRLKAGHPIYEIIQIFGVLLLDRMSVDEILTEYDYKKVKKLNCK